MAPASAPDQARARVVEQLGRARQAARRLRDGEDGPALHAFRVALRRLRVLLKASELELGRAAGRGLRRGLRRTARRAGRVRDLEVQAAWARRLAGGASGRREPLLSALAAALESEARAAGRKFRGKGLAAFRGQRKRLARRL